MRLRRAVSAEPGNPQCWLGLVEAQLDTGRHSDAMDAAAKALALARADGSWAWLEPQALGLQGLCLLAAGEHEEAVKLLGLFNERVDSGKPPNPWCDLQLVGDLIARGLAPERCAEYLRKVAAHAAATGDADLQWRVGPLLEGIQG